MSHIYGAHECECECHEAKGASMHIVACCKTCPHCHHRIKVGWMDEHLKQKHADKAQGNYATADGVEAAKKYEAARAVLERPSPFKDEF